MIQRYTKADLARTENWRSSLPREDKLKSSRPECGLTYLGKVYKYHSPAC